MGIVPFGLAFIYALLYSFGIVGAANTGFTFEFWIEVFESGQFFHSLWYSALIAGISLLISVFLALFFTIRYHKKLEGKFLSLIIYLPLCLPGIVTAFFMVQVLGKAGYISRLIYKLGIIQSISEFPELVNDRLALGIIIAFVSVVMPFFLLLFLSVYKHERIEELSTLAASLGASQNQISYQVAMKLLLHKTKTIISLYFIFLLGAYEIPLILGQESPQMLSVLVVRELNQYDLTRISEGYVVAVMYTLIVSIITIGLFTYRNKSVEDD